MRQDAQAEPVPGGGRTTDDSVFHDEAINSGIAPAPRSNAADVGEGGIAVLDHVNLVLDALLFLLTRLLILGQVLDGVTHVGRVLIRRILVVGGLRRSGRLGLTRLLIARTYQLYPKVLRRPIADGLVAGGVGVASHPLRSTLV